MTIVGVNSSQPPIQRNSGKEIISCKKLTKRNIKKSKKNYVEGKTIWLLQRGKVQKKSMEIRRRYKEKGDQKDFFRVRQEFKKVKKKKKKRKKWKITKYEKRRNKE